MINVKLNTYQTTLNTNRQYSNPECHYSEWPNGLRVLCDKLLTRKILTKIIVENTRVMEISFKGKRALVTGVSKGKLSYCYQSF